MLGPLQLKVVFCREPVKKDCFVPQGLDISEVDCVRRVWGGGGQAMQEQLNPCDLRRQAWMTLKWQPLCNVPMDEKKIDAEPIQNQ